MTLNTTINGDLSAEERHSNNRQWLAAAAACGALVWAYSLLDNFEQRKSDHLKEQCIALGGTFNPGDRPVLLKTATGKPPTCIH